VAFKDEQLDRAHQAASGGSKRSTAGRQPPSPAEALLDQAQSHLAAALDTGSRQPVKKSGSSAPFQLPSFDDEPGQAGASRDIHLLDEIELDVRLELGRTELRIEEVLQLKQGAVVALDKLAGDPVDIVVNGRLIARGEVLVINDNLCVRVAEILAPNS
jgi:flagellar motor switch protein FliN/FliY